MPQLEKLPPYDNEAEIAVLGSILIDDRVISRLAPILIPSDFFRDYNGIIYAACLNLFGRGEAINQITLAAELERHNKLAESGGAAYLAHCIAQVPTSLHAQYYAGIVQRAAVMRRLIQAGGKIAALGYENGAEPGKALGAAEELLSSLRQDSKTEGFIHLREVLEGCALEMTVPKGEQQEGARIPTGFGDLDRILGGMHPSDLIILAARPSMGKTALCLNIAEQVAMQEKRRVGIVSLEMSRDQLAYRLLASYATVDLQRLTLGRLSSAEDVRVVEAMGVLSEVAIYIDDGASLRVGEVRARAKQLATQCGLDLLVVDYAGLMRGSGRSENRVQELGEITRGLKALAKDLNIPVLLAAQLSRSPDQRPNHVPMLSDLRESGEIEQNADVVLFIYREDKYVDEEDWYRKNPTKPYPKGIADIIVAKHRNGPTGQCSFVFHEATTRFRSLELYREGGYYWQS